MVKKPQKPPNWKSIIKSDRSFKKRLPLSNEINDLIKKANEKYLYWEKFLSQPIKDIDKELAWAYLKQIRDTNKISTPLKDINGKTFTYWVPNTLQQNLFFLDQIALKQFSRKQEKLNFEENTKEIIQTLIDEAISSSRMEGAVTTIRVAKEMLLSNRKPKNISEQMIFNNYITVQSLKELSKENLSPKLICKIHSLISKDTLDDKKVGKFRSKTDQVEVVSNEGDILFTPPNQTKLKKMVADLCSFTNDEKEFIHPIIKAIIIHFYLAYLHPFIDGNGRVARALFYWYLIKHEYYLFEYLSISKIISHKPSQYGKAYLYTELDESDLNYFIYFHMKIILDSVDQLIDNINKEKQKTKAALVLTAPYLQLRI